MYYTAQDSGIATTYTYDMMDAGGNGEALPMQLLPDNGL